MPRALAAALSAARSSSPRSAINFSISRLISEFAGRVSPDAEAVPTRRVISPLIVLPFARSNNPDTVPRKNSSWTLAREVTKVHEEFLRGTVSGLLDRTKGKTIRGEITLLVGTASAPGETRPANSLIKREIEKLMAERGLDERAALKAAAKARGISRSEAYRLLQMEKTKRT